MCYSNIILPPLKMLKQNALFVFQTAVLLRFFSPLLLFLSVSRSLVFSNIIVFRWHSSEWFDVWIHLVACIYNEIHDRKHDLDLL